MMTRTLRPRNSLKKKERFSFDETPLQVRRGRSAGKKTGGLKDGKALTGEDEEAGLGATSTDSPSNELSSELRRGKNEEEDKTRKKGRGRGRPRGRSKRNEVKTLFPTDRNTNNVNSSQVVLNNTLKENHNSSAPVVGKKHKRKKEPGKEGLTESADVDADDGDIISSCETQSRKPTKSRKRKRQDDNEIIEDDVIKTYKVTSEYSKRRRKMVSGRAECLDDPTREKTSHTRGSHSSPTPDSSSNKISKKDYLDFQEVIAVAEPELKQNKTVVCPSCKKTKSKSLSNLVHHLRYFCPSSVKASGVSYDCTLCNRKCRSFATLDKHIKTVHSETNPLQSKSPENLTKIEFNKLRKQQGGKVKCPNADCKRTFTTVQGMKYHVPRCGVEIKPSLKCEYCGKVYASKPGLSAHIESRHSQPKFVVSSSKEEIDPMEKRGAAAKAMKKLHQLAVEGEVQDWSGNDNEFLSEMATCRLIKELFTSPAKYKPTPAELASWKSEVEQSGNASCPFCKKSLAAVKFLKVHVTGCKSRPGWEPFCCLTCKSKFKSRPQILQHLKASHRQLVVATLEKASKDEETKWEAADEDGEDEEYEDDEELEPEEEEAEDEQLVQEKKKKTKRFRNRFDGTKIDDSYRHVFVQVLKATDWTKQFRAKHYCSRSRTLFPDWRVDISKWKALSESVSTVYHPLTKESAMFVIEKRKGRLLQQKTEAVRLPLYGALPVEKAAQQVMFFVGGPVWAMSWCPVPDDNPLAHSYVALSCYLEMDHTQFFDELDPAPSLIQIWDLGVLKSGTTTTPKMVMGIAHDYGNTNDIQWCPSGGYEPLRDVSDSQEFSRLGLLAVACSVGFVTIYSIPHPKEEQTICKPDPVVTLKPTRLKEWFGQCLCLDWSQKEGHSRIVGGFGNGTVTVWNLHSTSSLLAEEMNGCKYLYPTQVLYACTSFVIAVSLNPHDDNYLLVCGIDRATSMWDLRFPNCPLDEINFCTTLDCHWPLHYQLGMVSTESHAINPKGCVVHLFDLGLYNSHFTELTLHSSVLSFSISDWLHSIAAGADDGQVGINVYTIPDKLAKHKCSTRLRQRIVTDICMEVKPSQLCDEPTSNQPPLPTSEKKEQAGNVTEDCAEQVESSNGHDQRSEMEGAGNGGERNKESIASQVLPEVKGHGDIELHNNPGTKSSNTEVQDERISEAGKVKDEKEMKTEKYDQQSSSQLMSNSKEGNQIISNFTERQLLVSSRTEAQGKDFQNAKEKEVLTVKVNGRTRHTEDEADSAKTQENDPSETRLLNEGDIEMLGDVADGVENCKMESIPSSDDVQTFIPTISGNLSDSIERNCRSNVDNVVTGNTLSPKGRQSIDNHGLENMTSVDEKNLDGKKVVVIHEKGRKDQTLGPLENGVDLNELSQKGSCESDEVLMAMPMKDVNVDSAKAESEPCALLDESKLNESKIESLDSQISELMATCHSTLEDLKESGTLSSESSVKQSVNEGKASPKKRKQKKKKKQHEKQVEVQQEKLCIMDKEFDIRQVLGNSDVAAENENDLTMEVDKDALRARVKAWRPKYEETEASKLVLYKDYFEPVYGSTTWTPISRKLLSRTPEVAKSTSTDFLLNAVNKVAWSPNFQSCRWLLMAGNNGIVRAVHMSCLEKSPKMKKS